MDESEDVAVYTAPWRQLGKDGRLHLFFPLLHNDLTCLPLPHNLLIPCCDLLVNLQNTQGHIGHLLHTSHQKKTIVTNKCAYKTLPEPCLSCPSQTCSGRAEMATPPFWSHAPPLHSKPTSAVPAPYNSGKREKGTDGDSGTTATYGTCHWQLVPSSKRSWRVLG